jgi:hypothetical protein
MNKLAVKRLIKSKFGSRARFCRLSGIDGYGLQKLLQRDEPNQWELDNVVSVIRSTPTDGTAYNEISGDLRRSIKEAIEGQGGVRKFCVEHPEFASRTIYHILNGDNVRKSKVLVALLAKLNLNDNAHA